MNLFVIRDAGYHQHGVSLYVLARSWYDAREWAKGKAWDGCTIEAAEALPAGVEPIRIEGTLTTTEIARAHGESLYAAGRKAGLAEAVKALKEASYHTSAMVLEIAFSQTIADEV